MPEPKERAARYRHHAEELRTMIDGWRDPSTLRMVSELASDFDQMAEDLERSAEANGLEPK